jgi:hypothetical protein
MYIFNKRVLPFEDLDGKTVEFRLSGRPKHPYLSGTGRFDIIPSGKPDFLRIEIRVRPPDGSSIRVPLSRTMAQCIKKASPQSAFDFCLFFHFQTKRAK